MPGSVSQWHVCPTSFPSRPSRPGRTAARPPARPGAARPRRRNPRATHPEVTRRCLGDRNIYNHAGLLVRHDPAALYTWHFMPGVQYLYTPFAAAGFAVTSFLPWALLKWLMAAASFAAVPVTVWVTFGQLGWRGRRRQA